MENSYRDNVNLTCHKEGIGIFLIWDKDTMHKINGRYPVHDYHQISQHALNIVTNKLIPNFLTEAFNDTPVLMQLQMF